MEILSSTFLNWRKRHKASYPETALQFDISDPGTIVTWQRKLDTKGVDALFTRRGRAKHMTTNNNKQAEKSELSELERLRAENRALRVENEYLKTRCLGSEAQTSQEKYQIIQELRQKFKYTLDEILPYTSLKRSTFYYQAQRIKQAKK